MPTEPDPSALSDEGLRSLHETVRAKLVSTGVLVRHVGEALHDSKSLDPAQDLLRTTLAVLDRAGARGRDDLVREVNLSNAALVAVIDLVRSHADTPRPSRPRSKKH